MQYPPEALIEIGVAPDEIGDLQLLPRRRLRECSGTGFRGRIALYEVHADERRDARAGPRRRVRDRDQAHGDIARHEDAAAERHSASSPKGCHDDRRSRPVTLPD